MAHTEYPIRVEQLVTGLFVRLELKEGQKNPFRASSFKIKSEKHIAAIRKMGLSHVVCVLDKSDRMPLPPEDADSGAGSGAGRGGAEAAPAPAKGEKTPVSRELLGLKSETVERNKERRRSFRKAEKKYESTMSSVVTILRRASGRSADAAAEAAQVVQGLVDTFLADRDTMINLMGSKPSEEAKNYHALNVTVLAMMVGSALKLKAELMQALGLGALFHDIGKGRVPLQAVRGSGATSMNKAAEKYMHEHPLIGARLVNDFPGFPKLSLAVVLQHHERMDGRGYPKNLRGEAISPLARIVAVVDKYDKLLNDQHAPKTYTPHEALKHMYATMRQGYDPRILAAFIRTMGVYPPGTVCKLSNGQYGMVVSSRPANPTRPTVLMYHPEIPKDEALMVDLVIEDEMEIKETMRPDDLPREVFSYLSPSRSINYYAEAGSGS